MNVSTAGRLVDGACGDRSCLSFLKYSRDILARSIKLWYDAGLLGFFVVVDEKEVKTDDNVVGG